MGKRTSVLVFAALLLAGYAVGMAADKVSRAKTGRALARVVTGAPCTPCEKAAMERANSSSEAGK